MHKSAREVIAEEIMMNGDQWDLDDEGLEAADEIIARLERYGFRIIRHRIVTDPPPKEWSRHGD